MGSNQMYWDETLRAYRLKKRVRALRLKMSLEDMRNKLNCSKQYLNNQTRTYLPGQDFIDRLESLENEPGHE